MMTLALINNIEDIEIIKNKTTGGFKIIVTPKNHLSCAPLIESIGINVYTMNIRRAKGHQFIYEIHQMMGQRDAPTPRFRLEILK